MPFRVPGFGIGVKAFYTIEFSASGYQSWIAANDLEVPAGAV